MSDSPRDLTATFDQARRHGTAVYDFDLRQDEIKLDEGVLSPDQVSRQVNPSRIAHNIQAESQRKAKEHADRAVFMMLLDTIRERVAELEDQLQRQYDELAQKYGTNVVDGLAMTFLSDIDVSGLSGQKLQALADRLLDGDGRIREEYSHLTEAHYVQSWQQLQTLRPVLAKYEGRNDLTVDEQREVLDIAMDLPNVDQENLALAAENLAARIALANSTDTTKADQESIPTGTNFQFQ